MLLAWGLWPGIAWPSWGQKHYYLITLYGKLCPRPYRELDSQTPNLTFCLSDQKPFQLWSSQKVCRCIYKHNNWHLGCFLSVWHCSKCLHVLTYFNNTVMSSMLSLSPLKKWGSWGYRKDFLNTPSWSMAALRFRPANSTGEGHICNPNFLLILSKNFRGSSQLKKSLIVPYIEVKPCRAAHSPRQMGGDREGVGWVAPHAHSGAHSHYTHVLWHRRREVLSL